ncbi:MAG: type II toxin-antitoxin system prevent-host-death family antitoxin [Proteobacteria bacterium]|nr:type II toxin-antitoxin system prevent-host-death family antitoxin [Pseudomonadota bacterium]
MPIIRPISDLRNNFNMISEICHKEGEPVFITKNGQGDLVVMSLAMYEKQKSLLDLYQKLGEAEIESASGAKTISHAGMMKKLKEKVNG